MSIIINDIDPQFQPEWLPAIGEYKPVWLDPSRKDPDLVTEYVHTERPEYILLKDVDDQGSGEFHWQVHKVLKGDDLKDFVNDPLWITQGYSDQLTVFSKVPWAWRISGIGKEDVPCFACTYNSLGGFSQIRTAVTTNRFDLTFYNPQTEDPLDNTSGVGPVASPYSGHAWSYDWNCDDPCSMTVDGVKEINYASGNVIASDSGNGGGSVPFPLIYNRQDFVSFSMLWSFQVMPPDEVVASDIYTGPCFPLDGGYPGIVPPTHIVSNEPDPFGNPNVNAGPWMKTASPNRNSPAKETYWRMEIEHFGPMVWAFQGLLESYQNASAWAELKNSINYVRPANLAPEDDDPNKPLEVPLDCFRFSKSGFSHSTQQNGTIVSIPLAVDTTISAPPPTDLVINDTPVTVSEPPAKPNIEIVGPPKIVVSTAITTDPVVDPGVNILDDDGNIIDTITSDDVNDVDLSVPGLYYLDYTWCYMNLVPQRYEDLEAVQAWILQNNLSPIGYVGDEEDQSIAKYPVYNMTADQINNLTKGEVTDAGYYGIYNYTDINVSVEPAVQSASGLWTFEFAGFCSTVTREVLVTDDEPTTFMVDTNGVVTAQDPQGNSLNLVDPDGNPITQTVVGEPVCVIDAKGRIACVMPEDIVNPPASGPANLTGTSQIIPPPASGPSLLDATMPNLPASGPLTLNATLGAITPPPLGPGNLAANPMPQALTDSAKYKGYVFDPRNSSIAGPFMSEAITAVTSKDNSSELYAVNQDNEIIKTELIELNNTYFDYVADPFTDTTTPLSGSGIIMSESGEGFMYRNMYRASAFSEPSVGYGIVKNPLYFKDAYLSIAETNWIHLGDEHNEKQLHRVDLRFYKNSCGHVFLYVQNEEGKIKGQYKGKIKEHMKVFTNIRGRGFRICLMIAAHKDHPWALREMSIGHLYGKSF